MIWPDTRPLRILVIRNRFIGDTILAIPALRNLRRAYPNARIEVLIEPNCGEILGPCPYQNELIPWMPRARKGRPPPQGVLIGLLKPALFLRRRRYDACYILRRSASSALLALLAGIPHRVGFATQGRSWMLSKSTPYPTDRHEVECFLAVLAADGIPIRDTHNEGWSDPATDEQVRRDLPASGRHRVFLSAKSSNVLKEWRPERFAAVVEWLIESRRFEIHVCDAPANRSYYDSIHAQLSVGAQKHWHDWSRRLDLRGTLSLLRAMQLHLGVDTGLTHMSATFHVPVVVLVEAWMTVRWKPWDTPHELVIGHRQAGAPTFDSIAVSDVQNAIDRLLSLLPPCPPNLD